MSSAITLAQIRDRVEAALVDSSNAIWTTTTLDEAVRQALDEYVMYLPRRLVVTLDLSTASALSTNGREIDLSVFSLSTLINVTDLWAVYLPGDTRPNVRKFDYWEDEEIIYLPDGDVLTTGDDARLFYTASHTINGLDSAVATTFRVGDESLMVEGALGYAARSRAIELTEKVKVDESAVEDLRSVANDALKSFRERLEKIREMRLGSEAKQR